MLGENQKAVDAYLDHFNLVVITDDIIDEAINLPYPLGGADAVHLATAIRLSSLPIAIATHDAQMARAAQAMGFVVIDPVTDDSRRLPVA